MAERSISLCEGAYHSRQPLQVKKIIDDEKLNKIWMDKTLFHIPKSQGSYINSQTGRLTSCGSRAKEKLNDNTVASKVCVDATETTPKKIRKCPPKCLVCCAMANPKDKEYKITQTTIYCSTCLVSLCIKKKGSRRASCFEIFHQIKDLTALKGKLDNATETPVNLCPTRKRKASDKRNK